MISSRLSPVVLLKEIENSVWALGFPAWFFGLGERLIAASADHVFSFLEASYIFTVVFLFLTWVGLKPESRVSNALEKIEDRILDPNLYEDEVSFQVVESRMLALKNQHMISQTHVLPFSYFSQIYHLLNLKHLETVHSTSLGSLKVTDVCELQPTPLGGSIRFQTALSTPMNLLKIWRKSVVEVELTLHTPHLVELNIPVYGDKRMVVMFGVFPLTDMTHEFLVDIYTDLPYPKVLLRSILHVASLFTLYEDLPYLEKLSNRELSSLLNSAKASTHRGMELFKRFAALHAPRLQQALGT